MFNNGWIRLHRKIKGSVVWSNDKALKIWINCLLRANHKKVDIFVGRRKVTLRPGDFVTSYPKFGKEVGYAQSTVYYWFGIFEVERMIERSKKGSFTIMTILNWDTYQKVERIVERSKKGQRKVKETDNNDKNEKNDKNKNIDIGKKKKEKKNYQKEHERLMNLFNSLFGKRTYSSRTWSKNYSLARETYTYEQIEEAIRLGKEYKWWGFRKDPNLKLIFRRSNKTGECDYIEEMLSLGVSTVKSERDWFEIFDKRLAEKNVGDRQYIVGEDGMTTVGEISAYKLWSDQNRNLLKVTRES